MGTVCPKGAHTATSTGSSAGVQEHQTSFLNIGDILSKYAKYSISSYHQIAMLFIGSKYHLDGFLSLMIAFGELHYINQMSFHEQSH